MDVSTRIKAVIYSIFDSFKKGDIKALESHMHKDASVWDVFTPEASQGDRWTWLTRVQQMKLVDTAGRIDKFKSKYAKFKK